MGLLGRQHWGGMVGVVCIGDPSLRNCPEARRPPGEGPAATQKVSGACLSPSLIMGDSEVRTLLCGVPELSLWSPQSTPNFWKGEGKPFVLTDQALGPCINLTHLQLFLVCLLS